MMAPRSQVFNIKLECGRILARCSYRPLHLQAPPHPGGDQDNLSALPVPTILHKDIWVSVARTGICFILCDFFEEEKSMSLLQPNRLT